MYGIEIMNPRALAAYERWVKIIPAPDLPPSTRPDGGIDIVDFRGYRFLSDLPLDDSPPLMRYEHFKAPMLRKFRHADETIRWCRRIGQGAEGVVYRVRFGEHGRSLALKVGSPKPRGFCRLSAEC
jgi:hypothetical protein